jgi:hypothetical protein
MWPVGGTSATTVAGSSGVSGTGLSKLNNPRSVILDNNEYVNEERLCSQYKPNLLRVSVVSHAHLTYFCTDYLLEKKMKMQQRG